MIIDISQETAVRYLKDRMDIGTYYLKAFIQQNSIVSKLIYHAVLPDSYIGSVPTSLHSSLPANVSAIGIPFELHPVRELSEYIEAYANIHDLSWLVFDDGVSRASDSFPKDSLLHSIPAMDGVLRVLLHRIDADSVLNGFDQMAFPS